MRSHLLSLSALHAAAPGVLDVVFGPDGDFEGAPRWTCPIWVEDAKGASRFEAYDWPPQDAWPETYHLDLRVHSVYARLLRLCSFVQFVDVDLSPEDLAALTLSLAPEIARLVQPRTP